MVPRMEVVYEDEQLLVCYKPAGLATQTSSIVQQDMVSQVKYYRTQKGEPPYVGVIHRLDQPVEGLLLLAKTEEAAALLSKQLQRRQMSKHYLAVITRNAFPDHGTLEDYLIKDSQAGKARVVTKQDPRAKLASFPMRRWKTPGGKSFWIFLWRRDGFIRSEPSWPPGQRRFSGMPNMAEQPPVGPLRCALIGSASRA